MMKTIKIKNEWNFLGIHDACKTFEMLNELSESFKDAPMSKVNTIDCYLKRKYPDKIFLFTEHGEHFVISEVYNDDESRKQTIKKIMDNL